MRRRGVALGLLVTGALGLVVGGSVLDVGPVIALGWATAAGVFCLLMLRGTGRQVLGVLLGVLGAGAAVAAGVAGGVALVAWLPAVLVIGGAVATVVWSGTWQSRSDAGPRVAAMDDWKQFDAGVDPTEPATGDDMVDDADPR